MLQVDDAFLSYDNTGDNLPLLRELLVQVNSCVI